MVPVQSILHFWPYFRDTCKVILSAGGLFLVLGKLILKFADVHGGLQALSAKMDQLTILLGHGLPIAPTLAFVNRVFPLSEFLGILSAYYTILILFTAVRWIRSFLPTIGG